MAEVMGKESPAPVCIWDKGFYQPEGVLPHAEQFKKGELRFSLAGTHLRGRFILLRPRSARLQSGTSKDQWLLIEENDFQTRVKRGRFLFCWSRPL